MTDMDLIKAAIRRGTADEVNGQSNGDIIVKGCEAAEYCDPEDAASAFVDGIAEEIASALPTERDLERVRTSRFRWVRRYFDLKTQHEAQSLSLSEAREEIERLRADIAVKAKLLTKSAKETRAFWDALIPKSDRCRDCADFDGRCQGDGPPCDPQAHALENLAKLQAASPDLSSLRKGAEVDAAAAYDFVAGWHERQAKLFREMAEDDPRTAKTDRDRAKEAAIHHAASAAALRNRASDVRRAALVSGSREEQL